MKIKKPNIIVDNVAVTDIYPLLDTAREEETSIREVEIKNVRLYGEDVSKMDFKSMIFDNCRINDCDFSKCSFIDVRFKNCDFTNAVLSFCPLKEFVVSGCRLVETKFFRTKLKGIDFTDSEMVGIVVADTHEELEGAIVSSWQAVELARLLKVIVK